MKESRSTLKTYFEAGDRPTEQQFENLIDSFVSSIDDRIVGNLNTIGGINALSFGSTTGIGVQLNGYNSIGDGGGGPVFWDPNQDKQNHNGITVFSPTWNNGTFGDTQDANWYAADGADTGSGAWVRDVDQLRLTHAGAVGDWDGTAGTDNSAAIQGLVNAIEPFVNIQSGWGTTENASVELTRGRYMVAEKIVVPGNKNITFFSNGISESSIEYTGTGDDVLDFPQSSINSDFEIKNITFVDGGIRIVGSSRGRIRIKNNQFHRTPGAGIHLIDDDLIGGSGLGVVHWVIEENDFNRCDSGVRVESDSILLGIIRKNRFNQTVQAPVYIDGTGIDIDDNEFQAVGTTNQPYIHLSAVNYATTQINIKNNRFGTEHVGTGGNWFPPENTVTIGGPDGHGSNHQFYDRIYFRDNLFFGSSSSSLTEANYAIAMHNNISNSVVEDNHFRNFFSGIVKETWWGSSGTADGGMNHFRYNRLQQNVTDTVFQHGGVGWIVNDHSLDWVNVKSLGKSTNLFPDGRDLLSWTAVNATVAKDVEDPALNPNNAFTVTSTGGTASVFETTTVDVSDNPFTIHFVARAGTLDAMTLQVLGVGINRTVYDSNRKIPLGPDWQSFSMSFPTASVTTSDRIRLRLFVGEGQTQSGESIQLAWGACYRGRVEPAMTVEGPNEQRTRSGSPVGNIIPWYIGEELLDTNSNVWYKATGLTNTDWVALN